MVLILEQRNFLILNSNESVGDASISKKLSSYLSDNRVSTEIIEYENPVESLKVISACDMFFSVRLHGGISAYLLNVPFLLVEYHAKCKDFLDYIGFDVENRITADVVNKKHIMNCLESLLQERVGGRVVEPAEYIEGSNKIFAESPWLK